MKTFFGPEVSLPDLPGVQSQIRESGHTTLTLEARPALTHRFDDAAAFCESDLRDESGECLARAIDTFKLREARR